MIVVDTNVISYLFLPGTHTSRAEAALRKDPEWSAPLLWRSEFRNVLAVYLQKEQITVGQALQLAHEAEALMLGREYEVPSDRVLTLASESNCSAYDCEFVALALHLGVPLVTSDSRIVRRFPGTAISLAQFGS